MLERRTLLGAGILHLAGVSACTRRQPHSSGESGKGSSMDYNVAIVDVPEQLLAAARERTTMRRVSQDIRRLLDNPWALIRAYFSRPLARHAMRPQAM